MADNVCPESTIADLVRDIQNKRSTAILVWDEPDRRVGSRMMTGTVTWSDIENVRVSDIVDTIGQILVKSA